MAIIPDSTPAYAELHCISNFTFLRGASHPEELVRQAARLNYTALALTDECSLAGIVRAHQAAKEVNLHLIIGSEIALADGPRLVLLATDRTAYGALSELITTGRRHAAKGDYQLHKAQLTAGLPGCLALLVPDRQLDLAVLQWLVELFPHRAWLAVELHRNSDDAEWLKQLMRMGKASGLPLVASGDVHMHQRRRRCLQDLITAIRLGVSVAEAGYDLNANGERYLRSRQRLAHLYPRELLTESIAIAERCVFNLDELRYEYPNDTVPPDATPQSYLRRLTEQGMLVRWPAGAPAYVKQLVERELSIINELGYAPYFITVYDIVRFAQERGILCQGRGSAANSAVCYCLGITAVDPSRMAVLFERFVSRERDEPPDIDVDFEHQRREEVIQYIYERYGRDRAALAATVITYRRRSALRDAGKALGFNLDQVERLVQRLGRWEDGIAATALKQAGFDATNPALLRLLAQVEELRGFPRHLSQHVGGLVISRGPLAQLVPIENADYARAHGDSMG